MYVATHSTASYTQAKKEIFIAVLNHQFYNTLSVKSDCTYIVSSSLRTWYKLLLDHCDE